MPFIHVWSVPALAKFETQRSLGKQRAERLDVPTPTSPFPRTWKRVFCVPVVVPIEKRGVVLAEVVLAIESGEPGVVEPMPTYPL